MKMPLSTSTAPLATLSLKLIDRSFDHGLIGKEGLEELPELLGQMNKRLPKPTKPLFVRF